jgi:hypothetical protein
MKLEKKIEGIVRDLREPADAETHDRILGHLLETQKQRTIIHGAFRLTIPRLATAAVVLTALVLLACFGLSLARSHSLYAGVVKALQDVNVVHISGWTTRISPTHSVAGDEPYDTSQRYEIETWEWFTPDGGYRLYDRQGPITLWDDGDRRHEHYADKNRLFVSTTQHRGRPYAAKFRAMTEDLDSLKQRSIRTTDLGVREIDGRRVKGLKTERGDRRYDLWIDTKTGLLVENDAYTLTNGQWRQIMHRLIRYDQPIPASIAAFVPPQAQSVHYSSDIDPRYEPWNQRLRRIAAHYRDHPLPEEMELLPCDSNEGPLAWCYAPGRLPGITEKTGHWVMPLRHTLGAFLQTEFKPVGCLRVPEDLAAIPLNHDLVTKNEYAGRARVEFVLGEFGLELAEAVEPRKVWIARYDGRPLKPWRQVKAPFPNPNHEPLRPGMAGATACPSTMGDLFHGFVFYQGQSLQADGILIVDETGLPTGPSLPPGYKGAVTGELPYWGGEASIEIARTWFQEQFGVTFTEETRPTTIHVVRRRP